MKVRIIPKSRVGIDGNHQSISSLFVFAVMKFDWQIKLNFQQILVDLFNFNFALF